MSIYLILRRTNREIKNKVLSTRLLYQRFYLNNLK